MEKGNRSNRFIAYIDGGDGLRLLGGKCTSCGEIFYPKQLGCPRCTKLDIEEVPLSRRGKLHTYTIVHQRPLDYKGEVPYIIGKVELTDGAFVLAQLADCAIESLKVDTEMELVIEKAGKDEDNNDILNYKFRPV
jgi:uncharacterized OB-fold protein